jgi:hypothetical protein
MAGLRGKRIVSDPPILRAIHFAKFSALRTSRDRSDTRNFNIDQNIFYAFYLKDIQIKYLNGAAMPDDFHLLKTVSVSDGEITFRIPQRWNVWPHATDEGRWGCYEEEAHNPETDTGTLWIDVDHIRVNVVVDDPGARDDFEDIAKVMASAPADAGTTVIENELRRVDRGYRWYRVYDADEDGEPLRYFSTTLLFFYGPSLSIINFTLVLTQAQMDEPDYLELREIVAREIAAARLEPFVHLEEAAAERNWGELTRLNYADKVKVVVPEIFLLDEDEEAARSPERPGGIDIRTEEISLCDETDESLVTVSEDYFVELLYRHLDE